MWQRRHFIVAYATARNVSMYTEARLGQLWQVLTPLLNSAVYYLIFGILFKANRGIANYTAYLVTGVFIFAFTERSIVVGSTVMRANMTLIRALHFPRACLPLAYVRRIHLPFALPFPFIVALAAGAGLRVVAMLGYPGALWFAGDSYVYLGAALRPQPNLSKTTGYSVFLHVLEPFHSLTLVAGLQHLVGLAVAVMIYCCCAAPACRSAGPRRPRCPCCATGS